MILRLLIVGAGFAFAARALGESQKTFRVNCYEIIHRMVIMATESDTVNERDETNDSYESQSYEINESDEGRGR